jgi:hypothetical protein
MMASTKSFGQRLHVGAIGQVGIGHDRRGIGIHEHDLIALFAECFASLRSRIIELAGLPDNDRAGADDEDFGNISALRHCPSSF